MINLEQSLSSDIDLSTDVRPFIRFAQKIYNVCGLCKYNLIGELVCRLLWAKVENPLLIEDIELNIKVEGPVFSNYVRHLDILK